MKVFKDWQGDKAASFVMFLAKEAQRQQSKLMYINKYFTVDAEADFIHILHVQQGLAAEASTLFMVAKDHFGFTDRKLNK
jgi:hypothetical protein